MGAPGEARERAAALERKFGELVLAETRRVRLVATMLLACDSIVSYFTAPTLALLYAVGTGVWVGLFVLLLLVPRRANEITAYVVIPAGVGVCVLARVRGHAWWACCFTTCRARGFCHARSPA